jgi:hypothetical protein
MRLSVKLFALASAAALLAGCASPVPKIDAAPSAIASVKTIAVIRSPEPKTYTVMNFGHPGMAFGAIGGLIAAADQQNKQERLTKAMKEKNATPTSGVLADSIATQLSRKGFDAKVEEAPWQEKDGNYRLDFAQIHSDADAVLVVAPTIVGFIATSALSDYTPTVTAVVTLLGKARQEQVYRGYHGTGWAPKQEGWKMRPAKAGFANFDQLMADPARTAGVLGEAAAQIGESVAQDLKP